MAGSRLRTPVLDRRRLMGLTTAAAGGVAFTAAGDISGAGRSAQASDEMPISPPEDLMREHGVLNRVLLVYREVIRRVAADEEFPRRELGAAARVIRTLIHDHHEHVEERYVFATLHRAGRLTSTVGVLLTQHAAGRELTFRLLAVDNVPHRPNARARRRLSATMAAFIRMYGPHEAREDTVVFPTFRAIVPPAALADLSETLREQEYRRFGPRGYDRFVDEVADIEKSLGIHGLAQFTPTNVPSTRSRTRS